MVSGLAQIFRVNPQSLEKNRSMFRSLNLLPVARTIGAKMAKTSVKIDSFWTFIYTCTQNGKLLYTLTLFQGHMKVYAVWRDR